MSDNGKLDAGIAAAITAAQRADDDTDAALLQGVHERLMNRIAEESTGRHLTVAAGEGQWRRLLPGIERKVLHEQDGVMSYLLKFAPGAVLPPHRHPHDEECVVLEGTLRIGELELAAGSFHRARRDLPHGQITSAGGCVIFLRGASPTAAHLL